MTSSFPSSTPSHFYISTKFQVQVATNFQLGTFMKNHKCQLAPKNVIEIHSQGNFKTFFSLLHQLYVIWRGCLGGAVFVLLKTWNYEPPYCTPCPWNC